MATSGNPPMSIVSRSTGEPSQISTRRDRNTLLMRPDWSLLAPELVHFISKKITKMDHYVYFRFVCRAWRLSCPPNPRHIIPQLPWLRCEPRPRDAMGKVTTLTFCDFSKSRTYKIELPYLADKRVCGHSRGWIVLEKDLELSLINPITKEIKRDCFPSLADPPPTIVKFAKTKETNSSPPSLTVHELSRFISKVILSSSPSERNCTIVMKSTRCRIGFCKIGGSRWTILEVEAFEDFQYKNDLVYAIDSSGRVTSYDLRDLSQKIVVAEFPNPRRSNKLYFVIGEGDLDGVLFVTRHVSYYSGSPKYRVFKCMTGTEGSSWTRVETIGNYVLLLGSIFRHTCEIIPLGNISLKGWEGNHICYCTDDGYPFFSDNGDDRYPWCVQMRSVDNGFEKIAVKPSGYFPRQLGEFSWFTPSLY